MSKSGTISVEIWDSSGAELTTALLPTDTPAIHLVVAIAEGLKLPLITSDGQRISYKLNDQRTRRQLLPDETLAQAGIGDGDTLRILREILAG